MKRLAVLALPFMCLAGPAVAADLEGPTYPERESYVRPPIVDRKIVSIITTITRLPPFIARSGFM